MSNNGFSAISEHIHENTIMAMKMLWSTLLGPLLYLDSSDTVFFPFFFFFTSVHHYNEFELKTWRLLSELGPFYAKYLHFQGQNNEATFENNTKQYQESMLFFFLTIVIIVNR